VAEESQDAVTSQWLIRNGSGQELKPQDYLAAFSQFVKDNPTHIEAISILLDRPSDWSTIALKELRLKLARTPQRFSEDLLQKAHAVAYRKALVDIISMVKHAAEEKQPLLTAQERVDRAIAKLTAGKTFTADQQKWLDRIRQHLVVNLTVDREDFDAMPIFADFGGWARADQSFEGKLCEFLNEVNAAIAA
jgi:type I restriction enzyme R subunit